MNPEDQALTAAHVERLVEVELAHRKEIAALQAIVLELRGRLGEAERLIGYLGELNMADTTFGREFDALQDSFDAFLAYSAHVVQLKNARAHAEESAPPVSTVDSRLAALEARVAALETTVQKLDAELAVYVPQHLGLTPYPPAALEKSGKGEAGATATAGPADAAAPRQCGCAPGDCASDDGVPPKPPTWCRLCQPGRDLPAPVAEAVKCACQKEIGDSPCPAHDCPVCHNHPDDCTCNLLLAKPQAAKPHAFVLDSRDIVFHASIQRCAVTGCGLARAIHAVPGVAK